MFDHLLGWHQRKGSWICTIQAEVRAIEEHPRVSHAVHTQCTICDGSRSGLRLKNPMEIVVVTRNALSLPPQHPAFFEPRSHPVDDDDLVPKGSLRNNRCDVFGAKRKMRYFVRHIGNNA